MEVAHEGEVLPEMHSCFFWHHFRDTNGWALNWILRCFSFGSLTLSFSIWGCSMAVNSAPGRGRRACSRTADSLSLWPLSCHPWSYLSLCVLFIWIIHFILTYYYTISPFALLLFVFIFHMNLGAPNPLQASWLHWIFSLCKVLYTLLFLNLGWLPNCIHMGLYLFIRVCVFFFITIKKCYHALFVLWFMAEPHLPWTKKNTKKTIEGRSLATCLGSR